MGLKPFIESLDMGIVRSIKKFEKGQRNDNYKIKTSKGNYVLKIYKKRKQSEIAFELTILNALKYLPVPQPIGKKKIVNYQDTHAIVYPYIKGTTRKRLNQKHLIEIGNFIGNFHTICKKKKWKGKRNKFYSFSSQKIKHIQNEAKKARLSHLSYLPLLMQELKKHKLSSQLPKGPIHVDIKPENVLFHKGKLSGVIDFDNMYIGSLVLDLAKAMVWFGIENKKLNIKKALWIYKGYSQKRKLTRIERNELYKAIKFAIISHLVMDYYMRAINETTQSYFESVVKNFYPAYQSFAMTRKEFDNLINN